MTETSPIYYSNYNNTDKIPRLQTFRGVSSNPQQTQTSQPHTVTYPNDTVEISAKNKVKKEGKKSGMSTGTKWALGISCTLGTLATIALLIKKNKYSEAKQLAEHITFEKAKTLEDAIKFGKEHLGIQAYTGFEAKDLEVINWVNEGLVNTSNKLKGKIRVPKYVQYIDSGVFDENALAGVITEGKYKGWFGVNKKIFNNLDADIKTGLENFEEIIKVNPDGTFTHDPIFDRESLQPLASKILKFKENKITSFDEKVELYESLEQLERDVNSINKAPLYRIKNILKENKLLESLNKNGMKIDLKEVEKLNIEEQSNLFYKMEDVLKKDGINVCFPIKQANKFNTIYHEMGHMQDDVARVMAKEKFKTPDEYPAELKEWLSNDKYQQIASDISAYSCSGPGEFIAETFAELVSGKKLNEDVIKLYKELKGPLVPGM